ncbi:hypothetical protein ACLVWU_13350 [Bdellovibrio sp. HCB290]|uniref:hypothetical protein n=1 Tax=Bdellovibrio sp. HCB290 TaxID=3394356 RepID=UPI0039B3C90A
MRHVAIIATAMIFTLTACRKTTDEDALRIANAKSAEQQQQKQLNHAKFQRDFVADARTSENLKQQFPMEHACIMDLCGSEFQKYPSITKLIEAATTPTPEQQKYYETYIAPTLAKNSELLQEKALVGLEVLNAKESAFPTQELTEQQLHTIHTIYWVKNKAKNAGLDYYWNNTLPKKPFFAANIALYQMGTWAFFSELHPNLTLQESTKAVLESTQSKLTQLANIIQGAEKIDPSIAAKINKGELITAEEAKNLAAFAFSIELMHHFILGEGRNVIVNIMEDHTFSKEELFKIYQESGIKTTLALQSKSTTPNNCQPRYFQSINLYPQAQDLEKFKKMAELTRQEAMEQVGPTQPGYDKIQNLKFHYPLTAEEKSTAWLQSLEMKNRVLVDEITALDKLDTKSLYAMFLLRSITNSPDSAKTDQCPTIPEKEDVTDKTNTDTSNVSISWYSVRFPEMGASILAHEIGHNAYKASSPQSTESTKQCLERKQGTDKYLSEDYADLFAAKVMIRLKAKHQISAGNIGCGLMDVPQLLFNLNEKSIHSSDLYRALQVKVETGEKVPASCEQLAQRDGRAITHSCQ